MAIPAEFGALCSVFRDNNMLFFLAFKNIDSQEIIVDGDYKFGDTAVKFLEAQDIASWLPTTTPPKLDQPMKKFKTNQAAIKREASKFMKYLSGGKVNYGVSHSYIWLHRISTEVLPYTTPEDFEKWGLFKDTICMQDIVDWSEVKITISNAPKQKKLNIPWIRALLLFIEIDHVILRRHPDLNIDRTRNKHTTNSTKTKSLN